MIHRGTRKTVRTLGLALSLTFGCTGGGGGGCGSPPNESDSGQQNSAQQPTSRVDASSAAAQSKLVGVYEIRAYRGSATGCEELVDSEQAPGFIAIYPFMPAQKDAGPRIAGAFCSSVEDCGRVARQGIEPAIGYSFLEGTDVEGWQGWGIADTGVSDDQCRATVQSHTLTSTGGETVRIETKTVEALFAPAGADGEETCRHRDAIAAVSDTLECQGMMVVEAARAPTP